MDAPIAASVQILETAKGGTYETLRWLSIADAKTLVDTLCEKHNIPREHAGEESKGFFEIGNGIVITLSPTWPQQASIYCELQGLDPPRTLEAICRAFLTTVQDKPRTLHPINKNSILYVAVQKSNSDSHQEAL